MIKESKSIKRKVFKLPNNLSQYNTNSPKITEIMGQLIQYLNGIGFEDALKVQ